MVTVGGGTRGLQGFEATASKAASKSNNEIGVASHLACYKATKLQSYNRWQMQHTFDSKSTSIALVGGSMHVWNALHLCSESYFKLVG